MIQLFKFQRNACTVGLWQGIFFSQSLRFEKHVHVRKTYYIRKVGGDGGAGGVSVGQKKRLAPSL